MNPKPTVAVQSDSRETLLEKMNLKCLRHIPIVDSRNRVMGIEVLESLLLPLEKENWVVLLAGGLGTRLAPLTSACPKPLLPIGDQPLLETILQNLKLKGFRKFYLSVNYKAEMIEDYFRDGSRWDVEIRYLRENQRLGTAGSLSLLPEKPTHPLLVMNGDLLTNLDFEKLLDFHMTRKFLATMCIREYDLQVPYGVVKVDQHRLMGLEEKPVIRFFMNAGIYVLKPEVLQYIPGNSYFDMTSLFEKLLQENQETGVFPIREYWLDIGQMDDFERAKGDFAGLFSDQTRNL